MNCRHPAFFLQPIILLVLELASKSELFDFAMHT